MLALHAPDGLFSMPVNLLFAGVVVVVLVAASASLTRRGDHRLVPMMGIMAAFVFAGQMVNFPVASGTSGHLVGGTLSAILLGPWAATLVMAVVVFFQALLGDGGVTVLGPNIFNLGVIGTCLGYLVYRAALGNAFHRPARIVAASFFAAWVGLVLASVLVSLQLAVSGTASLRRALPAMVAVHMLIGVGEALITALIVAFVLKTRPDLLYGRPASALRTLGRRAVLFGLAASLAIAVFLAPLPALSAYPDGLESITAGQGQPPMIALLPDYTVPGVGGLRSTSLAGAIGTIVMFGASFAVGHVLTRPSRLARALASSSGT